MHQAGAVDAASASASPAASVAGPTGSGPSRHRLRSDGPGDEHGGQPGGSRRARPRPPAPRTRRRPCAAATSRRNRPQERRRRGPGTGMDDLDRDRPAAGGMRPGTPGPIPPDPSRACRPELPDHARILRAKRKHQPPVSHRLRCVPQGLPSPRPVNGPTVWCRIQPISPCKHGPGPVLTAFLTSPASGADFRYIPRYSVRSARLVVRIRFRLDGACSSTGGQMAANGNFRRHTEERQSGA